MLRKLKALELILGVTEAYHNHNVSQTDALIERETQNLLRKTQEVYDAIEAKKGAEIRAAHEDTIEAFLNSAQASADAAMTDRLQVESDAATVAADRIVVEANAAQVAADLVDVQTLATAIEASVGASATTVEADTATVAIDK